MKLTGKSSERGSVVMEAALITPFVLMMLWGLLEFGEILRLQQALTNAAREGARVGAIHMDTSSALSSATTTTTDYLTRTGVDLQNIDIDSNFADVNGTEMIEIIISYDYASRLTVWVPGLDHFDLRSRVVMRREA